MHYDRLTRRKFLGLLGAGTAMALVPGVGVQAATMPLTKKIPGTNESIPVIGMGTWQTFNVGGNTKLRNDRTQVLKTFFEEGGSMVDSSPMYGSAQDVMGYAMKRLEDHRDALFSADKIWTHDADATRSQLEETRSKWGVKRFDLMQIHNLRAWEGHLKTLNELKKDGNIRYVGITTSHGRRHSDLESIMKSHDLDFVQLTYNITHRRVENRLLKVAQDRGIGVIANRPFDGGNLIKGIKRAKHPLPEWAADFDCENWASFLLKFVVSHPALTVAIPATTKVGHMRENMSALRGQLPDEATRLKMIRHVESL